MLGSIVRLSYAIMYIAQYIAEPFSIVSQMLVCGFDSRFKRVAEAIVIINILTRSFLNAIYVRESRASDVRSV